MEENMHDNTNTAPNNEIDDNARLSIKDNIRLRVKSPKLADGIIMGEVTPKAVPGSYCLSTLPANTSKLSLSKHKSKSTSLRSNQKPLRLRIVLIGSEKTGKSCLIKRYCEKRFVSKYMPTIGIDYGATKIYVDKCEVSVHIFDTSGSALFSDVRNEFYYDAHGILLVFDVTRRETFENLTGWVQEIKDELQRRSFQNIKNESYHNNIPDLTPIVLVCGNKIDLLDTKEHEQLDNNVDEVEARLWSDVHGLQYCETSASSGEGVGDMFHTFFSTIVRQQLDIMTNGGKLPKTPLSAR